MSGFVWGVTAVMFGCGLAAVVFRRQLIAMLLGLELMITAVNVALVYQAGLFSDVEGLAAALLIIAIGSGEAVVGLALILRVTRLGRDPESTALQELRG